ncbi:MAG: FecR domain-containing protein [Opitutaceae bacterium]|nr:FecR domain-containing protein [Opitutaceae bacterium]
MNPEPAAPRDRLPAGWIDRTEIRRSVLAELESRAAVRRRRRRAFAGAACAVLLLGAGAVVWQRPASPPPRATAATFTEPRRERLPDGSLVELRGDAAVTVDFSGAARRVLLTRGTAHFAVAKNPARPFVVTAGGVAVRAVGTAFSVALATPSVEVLVTEGRVAVESSASPAAPPLATLDAGAGIVLRLAAPAAPVLQDVPPTALEEKLAWRVRHLEFSGTPLAEAVAMLNRHNRVQFVLADPSLAGVKLSGVIRADRIAGVIRLLEEDCGVRAEHTSDHEIVLRRAR